jgi:hypothetical protein
VDVGGDRPNMRRPASTTTRRTASTRIFPPKTFARFDLIWILIREFAWIFVVDPPAPERTRI